MIVQVLDKLIETNFIYNISEVEQNWEAYDDYKKIRANCTFHIYFLNSNMISIYKVSSRYTSRLDEEFEKISEELYINMNKVRDALIKYWNKSKLNIPKIDIDESNIIT